MRLSLLFLVFALIALVACTYAPIDDGTPGGDHGTTPRPNTSGVDDVFSDGDGISPPPIPS